MVFYSTLIANGLIGSYLQAIVDSNTGSGYRAKIVSYASEYSGTAGSQVLVYDLEK